MPCFTLAPPADETAPRLFRAWVPADDAHTCVLSVYWHPDGAAGEAQRAAWPAAEIAHRSLAESPGPVADRTREHLGTSDKAVSAFRARLLAAARRLEQGIEPQAPYDPDCYRVRAYAGRVAREERDFIELESIQRAMLAP
jgi:phthalate 4,5-dioxygenase